MRYRIVGVLLECTLKKWNCILRVPTVKKRDSQGRTGLCVLRISFNDLAKQRNSVPVMAGTLQRQSQLILGFRGRGIEADRALERHDGLVIFIIRRISPSQLRCRDRAVGSELGGLGQFWYCCRRLLLHELRYPQMHVSRSELRI